MLAHLLLAGSIGITSPRELQVFQRDAHDVGHVRVEATAPDEVATLGASVDAKNGAAIAWTPLEMEDLPGPTRRFHGTLEVKAGGWYSLAFSTAQGTAPIASVQRFGVGEIFVVAGQSNSTNFGEERFPSQDDQVVAFDGEHWTIAADPMPGVQDKSQGGSPWPLCGKLLREFLGVPVAFASCGYGGTSIRQWQKTSKFEISGAKVDLYGGLARRVRALGEFRAILWHQGESDAAGGMGKAEYVELFRKLASDLAQDTGSHAPWIVAQASYVPDAEESKRNAIRDAQAELWEKGDALRGPNTDELVGDYRHSKDHVHFSKKGLEAHAARWCTWIRTHFFLQAKPK
jgi:hypothetical protein